MKVNIGMKNSGFVTFDITGIQFSADFGTKVRKLFLILLSVYFELTL